MKTICHKSDFYRDGTAVNTCLTTSEVYCLHCGKPVERRCKHGTVLFYVIRCSCGYYYYGADNNGVEQTEQMKKQCVEILKLKKENLELRCKIARLKIEGA